VSLAGHYDTLHAGCLSFPQSGIVLVDEPRQYQIKIWEGGRQTFYRFNYPVSLFWDCPQPPAQVKLYFLERPDLEPDTDPLLSIEAFLPVCDSPGLYKGTSRWFWSYDIYFKWAGNAARIAQTIHIQEYKTNVGSIGITRYPLPPV